MVKREIARKEKVAQLSIKYGPVLANQMVPKSCKLSSLKSS